MVTAREAVPSSAHALRARASCKEASPSLVYGAALLMRFGVTPHPGFKSRSLRPVRAPPVLRRAGLLHAPHRVGPHCVTSPEPALRPRPRAGQGVSYACVSCVSRVYAPYVPGRARGRVVRDCLSRTRLRGGTRTRSGSGSRNGRRRGCGEAEGWTAGCVRTGEPPPEQHPARRDARPERKHPPHATPTPRRRTPLIMER